MAKKKIYLIGVYHALPELGSPEIYLIHEDLSTQIIKDLNEVLISPKTLIISEDANIPSCIHPCKCGSCKPEGDNRLFILKSIFGKQHTGFLNETKADVVIADKRMLATESFSKYSKLCEQAVNEKLIEITNIDFFANPKGTKVASAKEVFDYLINHGILVLNKPKLKELFSDYLKDGFEGYENLRTTALANDCDDTLLRSINLHLGEICPIHTYDNLVVIAGSMHTEKIHSSQAISHEYVYSNYGFNPNNIGEDIMKKARENLTSWKICFNLLIVPSKDFSEVVFG